MAVTIIEGDAAVRLYSVTDYHITASSTRTDEIQFAYAIDIVNATNDSTFLTEPIIKQANPNGRLVFSPSRVFNDNLRYRPERLSLGNTFGTSAPNNSAYAFGIGTPNEHREFKVIIGEQYQDANGTLKTSLSNFPDDYDSSYDTPVETADIDVVKGYADLYARDDNDDNDDFADEALLSSNLPDKIEFTPTEHWNLTKYDTGVFRNYLTYKAGGFEVGDTGTFGDEEADFTVDFEVVADDGDYGRVSFVWLNDKGGWDTFIATEEETEQVTSRKSVSDASPVLWSGTDSLIGEISYEGLGRVYRPNKNIYDVRYDVIKTKNTQWITDDFKYIEGLFESPLVFVNVYTGTSPSVVKYLPVEILNTRYEAIRTTRDNPLATYAIQYRFQQERRNR